MARGNGTPKQSDVVEELTVMDLPVALSEKEDLKRRKELEAAALLVANVEFEMKEAAATFRESLKAAEADRDRLIRVVTTKTELRPTKVRIEKDFKKGEKRIVRLDTGVLHERVDLEPEDHQLDLERNVPRHAGDAVTDKPPAGEAGKKLVGRSKVPDVETPRRPAAPTPEAGGDEMIPVES